MPTKTQEAIIVLLVWIALEVKAANFRAAGDKHPYLWACFTVICVLVGMYSATRF